MQNFDYHNPTKIVFGQGGVARLPELLPSKKVLLLYGGGSIKKNGTYEAVIQALKGFDVFEVGGVQPNPIYEKALEAIHLIRKEKIDFILAVGGGSVIDSAKFISLAVHYNGEPWDILTNRELTFAGAVPFGCVLTIPATGSEMNCYYVISKGPEKLSGGNPLVYPQFSILDPALTLSLDKRQVGNGVVDAYVHVMEQYLTYPVGGTLQDRFSESILQTLIEEGTKSYNRPQDLESRASLMWCATMALSGISGAGVPQDWSTHMIGHELTALYGIDHARTLAIVLPAMMWVMRDEKRLKISQYAERIWRVTGSDEDLLKGAMRKTTAFFESVGVPTKLHAYGINEDVATKVVNRLKERGITHLGERDQVTLEKVSEVLRIALK